MDSVQILTQSGLWRKARAANYATNGFRTFVPTITDPRGPTTGALTDTAPSAFDIERNSGVGSPVQNTVHVKPYAIGADNVTFSIRVWVWTLTGTNPATWLYDPMMLCQIACTASAVVGVAGRDVLNTERFADTLTVTTGNSGISLEVLSPTGDIAGWFRQDLMGPFYLDFDFTTGGSATSCNALWRMY